MKQKIITLCLLLASLFLAACNNQVPNIDSNPPDHSQLMNLETGLNNGNIAPDFSVNSVTGNSINLYSEFKDKKPTVVYFFATWCPFCKNDFSALSKVYPGYSDDISFIAIDLDLKEKSDAIASYQKRFPGLSEVKFSEGNIDVLSKYKIRHTTTKYALLKDGSILYSGSGEISEDQWKGLFDAMI